jgi:hypothetical protein
MIYNLVTRDAHQLSAHTVRHNHALIPADVQMTGDYKMVAPTKERLALWAVHDIVDGAP